jgi:WD40 repeat protein
MSAPAVTRRLAALVMAAVTTACSSAPEPPAPQASTGRVPVSVALELSSQVTSLAVVNQSPAVVLGLADGQVALWNGRDAMPGAMWKPHAARVIAVGSTGDGGEILSVGVDGSLARTPRGTIAPSVVLKLDLGAAGTRAAAVSPDGSLLVTGGEFGEIRVYDTASGTLRHQLRGHRTEIQALAVSGTGTIATASAEADLRLWNAASGAEVKSIESDLSLFAVSFSRRGDVLASGGVDRRLTLRDATSWATTGDVALRAPRMVASVAWSPDDRFLALGDLDDETLSKGGIEIVDAASRAVVATLDTGGMPAASLAVMPDGVVVAATGPSTRSWIVPAAASRSARVEP